MPLTERERHDAYEVLQATFGEHTDTVIQLLRPDHEYLATSDDVALLAFDERTETTDLRVAFAADIDTAFAAHTRTMMIGLVSAVLLIALSNALAVPAD